MESRIPLKGEDMEWRILDKLMAGADNFHQELQARKGDMRAKPASGKTKKRRLAPW